MPIPGPIGNTPNSLGILQAMQSTLLAEALIGGVSPFAALSAADQARYGVARAVYVGKPTRASPDVRILTDNFRMRKA